MIVKSVYCYYTVVPHITDAIQEWVERVAKIPVDGDNKTPDVCIIEVYITLSYIPASIFHIINKCVKAKIHHSLKKKDSFAAFAALPQI
jgi:CTP synthase (UTP-ammonia lyase)